MIHPRDVRCVSLHQPWATLVAVGEKQIETRGWRTHFRGVLLIHAARAKTDPIAWSNDAIRSALARHGYLEPEHLPRGALLARAKLLGCAEMVTPGELDDPYALRLRHDDGTETEIPELEYPFGGYEAGRFAWLLGAVHELNNPVDLPGRQGLWLPPELAALSALAKDG